MKLHRRSACLSTLFVLLLGGISPAQAFIGDDKLTVASEYGEPVAAESTPAIETYSYHTIGYRVGVTFEGGKSAAETFYKLAGDKAFSAEEIRDFLKGYEMNKEWTPATAKAGEQRWHCGGETASYSSEGEVPCLAVVSDFYLEKCSGVAASGRSCEEVKPPAKLRRSVFSNQKVLVWRPDHPDA